VSIAKKTTTKSVALTNNIPPTHANKSSAQYSLKRRNHPCSRRYSHDKPNANRAPSVSNKWKAIAKLSSRNITEPSKTASAL
jgi:hypothetical protein